MMVSVGQLTGGYSYSSSPVSELSAARSELASFASEVPPSATSGIAAELEQPAAVTSTTSPASAEMLASAKTFFVSCIFRDASGLKRGSRAPSEGSHGASVRSSTYVHFAGASTAEDARP